MSLAQAVADHPVADAIVGIVAVLAGLLTMWLKRKIKI